jgi:hypothetical protein
MQRKDVRRGDSDGGAAFLPDPRSGQPTRSRDTLAELVAEQFVNAATSAEDQFDEARNAVSDDELGGPFLEVDAEQEIALEPDESNPIDAEAEPFPTAVRVPRS